MSKVKISPSILAADFSNLEREIKAISAADADYIHIDVMDGSFVPPITLGADIIASIKKHSSTPFDVHLMINNPDNHVADFAKNGADIITIHEEATTHLHRSLSKIKNLGVKAGVSIVPSTHEDTLDYILDEVDLILVMSVNPGFGGQKFITSQLKKIENLANKIAKTNRQIELEVDGGINDKNSQDIINAGANVLVAGSYIFGQENYGDAIRKLRG